MNYKATSAQFHEQINAELTKKGCEFQRKLIGHSAGGKPLYSYRFGTRHTKYLLVTSCVHGLEKGAAIVAAKAMRLLCHSTKPVVIIPIVNPDGYDILRGRRNSAGVDINRDGFSATQPETVAVLRALRGAKRYVDIHMTGNVVLWPRKASRQSYRFSRLLSRKLHFYLVKAKPSTMLIDRANQMGVPSALIEVGTRRDFRRGIYTANTSKVAAVLSQLN